MPVKPCQDEGKPGYRWGDSGKCYTYTPSSDSSRERARAAAERQGRAARAGGYEGMMKSEDWLGKPLYDELDGAEKDFADALLAISEKYGPLDDESGTPTGPWVGYVDPEQNEDREIGVKCGNCALIASENACAIIAGEINPEGKCRLAVIPEGYVSAGMSKWKGSFLPVVP